MKPVVKVLIVVVVVLIVIHIIKRSMRTDAPETYIPFLQQEFETVPPLPFAVTKLPLMINGQLTADPATMMPTMMPSMMPTMMPSIMPTMMPTMQPTMMPTRPVEEVITTIPIVRTMAPTGTPGP